MKKALCLIIAAVIVAAAYMAWVRYVSERSIVIISTTDVHAKVENFPRLATAIARCRDTVATIVADAGDRWTGNAYVDMAREPRRPVIDMMNAMGYDVATLGNHEFDDGQAFLGHINSLCRFDADVAFYHFGGIRYDSLPERSISTGVIYGLEPFSSTLYTMRMTPAQMRRMIISKYNDTVNPTESHRIDLFSTTPYTICLDARGEAVDVIFPDLEEADTYRVVMGDYMYKNYRDIEATDVVDEGVLLTDVLINHLRENSPIDYSNEGLQNIRRVE